MTYILRHRTTERTASDQQTTEGGRLRGWETAGALQDLRELSVCGSRGAPSFMSPCTLIGWRELYWGFGLPVRSPQRGPQLHCLEPSASTQREQEERQAAAHRPDLRARAAVPRLCAWRPECGLGSQQLPKLPAHGTCTEVLLHGTLSVQQMRDGTQKVESQELFRDFRNSQGLKQQVSTTTYIPLNLHRVAGDSIQVLPACLQGHCSVFLDILPGGNKGRTQNQQGTTTHTWPPYPKPLQLGGPVPQMP